MAGELSFSLPGLTGSTLYAIVRRPSDGAVRDVVAGAWDAWQSADIDDYDVALTEQGGSGRWLGNLPSGVTAPYTYEVCRRVGGTPAITDPVVGLGASETWAGLTAAVLARFATVDTGETTAVAGSVAKIAQGAADAAEIAAELVGTGFGVTPAAQLPAGQLTATRYAEWVLPAISVGALPADRSALWWTVKKRAGDGDPLAIVQVSEEDDLLLLNRAAPASPITSGDGALTYNSGTDEVTPWLSTAASALVEARGGYVWDVKYRDADGESHVVAHGTLVVSDTVTHRTE